jgi:hypothetical protein
VQVLEILATMTNHIQLEHKAHKYTTVPCDPEYLDPTPRPGWSVSNTKHTLGPELLGLILGWERAPGLELAGAHPKAAGKRPKNQRRVQVRELLARMPNHIQLEPKFHRYAVVPCDPEYLDPTQRPRVVHINH